MVEWSLGTIGFSYPEWKGNFYPSGLSSQDALRFYSHAFNAVEINTTFYGAKSAEQMQSWSALTPEDFCFSLKAPRHITHDLRLEGAAAEELRAFAGISRALQQKLGAILIQLPPSLHADSLPQVEKFLAGLRVEPGDQAIQYAIEFRHASWYAPKAAEATADALRAHQVCWVSVDYENLPLTVTPTADFLYIRWIGRHNVLAHPGYEVLDRAERLQGWVERIQQAMTNANPPVERIFGFFDNDYAGFAPASCRRLKRLLGLPESGDSGAEQGRLF